MRTGDLIATGTLTGPKRQEVGSLLEATLDGEKPSEAHALGPETQGSVIRSFLEDGDEVEFRVSSKDPRGRGTSRIGFGSCSGKILSPVSRKA